MMFKWVLFDDFDSMLLSSLSNLNKLLLNVRYGGGIICIHHSNASHRIYFLLFHQILIDVKLTI